MSPRIKHTSTVLYTIYLIGFIFTLQQTLPVYINSTFLHQFMPENVVGLVYITAALLTIVALGSIGYFMRRFGNYKTVRGLIWLQIAALLGVILSSNIIWLLIFFISNLIFVNLISYGIDLLLEAHSTDTHTGSIRGLYMTILNIAWILSPLLAGALVVTSDYWKIYAVSITLLLPLLYLLHNNFKNYKDPKYASTSLWVTFKRLWKDHDFKNLYSAGLTLNTFYSWMIVYTPIYLHEHIGFDWETIGLIFTVMLLPFILLEFPVGTLADKRYGEKEFMCTGFFIMGISTVCMAFITSKNMFLWMAILFISRIGASMTEVMVETYFFKKIHTKDDTILSVFRTSRSVAYIVAPLITFVSLLFLQYNYLFAVLGVFTLCGFMFALRIHDTN